MDQMRHSRRFIVIFICILLLHVGLLPLKSGPSVSIHHRIKHDLIVKVLRDVTKNQIVQSRDSDIELDRKTSYLSDKNRSFERQTRSRVVEKFRDLSMSDLALGNRDPFRVAAKKQQKHKKSSSSNDYLQVPLGDVTQLNTAEYKYYGYFHRIKLKLEQYWGRSLSQKALELKSGGRRLPSADEFITGLRVTLNANGKIIELAILNSSGIQELDDAAVESFNQAGPFPNPPKGLIVNGKVVIEWGFVVKS